MNRILFAVIVTIAIGAPALIGHRDSLVAGVVDYQGMIQTNANLAIHYSFDGATAVEQRDNKASALSTYDLGDASYGGATQSVGFSHGYNYGSVAMRPYRLGGSGTGLKTGAVSLPGSELTVEAVVRPYDVSAAEQYAVAYSGSPTRGYFLFSDSGRLLGATGNGSFDESGAMRAIVPDTDYTPGHWYYAAATYRIDGGNTKVSTYYADLTRGDQALTQVVDDSTVPGVFATSGSRLGIGMFGAGNTQAFDGMLDEVAIYDTTLQQGTLQSHLEALSQTEVVYREIFPNNSGGNEVLGDEGWQIHKTGGLLETDQINSGSYSAPSNDLIAVNSNPTVQAPVPGYAFTNDTNGLDYLFWTDEYAIDTNKWAIDEISWYQANHSGDGSRAAVRIDGQWFASDEVFTNTIPGDINNNAPLRSLDFASAEWRSLDFQPGASLSLGGTAVLPEGSIDAFGWFVENKTNRLRLDSYTIRATYVPEPSSGLLLILATLVGLVCGRWRRS